MLSISHNFAVKSIICPNFGQGPFPKIDGKTHDFANGKTCVNLCCLLATLSDFLTTKSIFLNIA